MARAGRGLRRRLADQRAVEIQLVCSCPATAYGRWRGCAFGGYLYPFIPLKVA
jgi:hypothetical protein